MTPSLHRIDHIHVFVADRAASKQWYEQVLGLKRVPELASWSADGGPLTLANETGSVHLALFERSTEPCRSTIALGVSAVDFIAWKTHISEVLAKPVRIVDHQLSWSMYFSDPDANPYEITTYEYAEVSRLLTATGG